jgi:hypothetical protein
MQFILKRWQDSWDQQIYNKLHEIHSLVGKTPCFTVKIGRNKYSWQDVVSDIVY